jgi:hypothetical protein
VLEIHPRALEEQTPEALDQGRARAIGGRRLRLAVRAVRAKRAGVDLQHYATASPEIADLPADQIADLKSYYLARAPAPSAKPATSSTAWRSEEWVAPDAPARTNGRISSADAGKEITMTRGQAYDAIAKVAPHLPHNLLVLMVALSWAEQQGAHVYAFNFFGKEGDTGGATVMAKTSGTRDPQVVRDHRSDYLDWPGGVLHGREASSVDAQLDAGYAEIGCMFYAARPGYRSLEEAAADFVREVERRIRILERSTDPSHNALAKSALDGDAKSFGEIMNNQFHTKTADGQKEWFGTFQPDKGDPDPAKHNTYKGMTYAEKVVVQNETAREDLKDRAK